MPSTATYLAVGAAGAIAVGAAAFFLSRPSTIPGTVSCSTTSPCSPQCPDGVCSAGTCNAGVCSTVTPVGCTVDSDCSIGLVCVNGECVSCELASAPCSSQCPDNGLCPGGELCSDGSCISSACTISSDCPVGSTCSDGTCVSCAHVNAPCSHQCPEGTCAEGYGCVDGVCEKNRPTCLSPCSNDSECVEGYDCVNGCCEYEPRGPGCGACSVQCPNGSCPSGYFCDRGVCERGLM